MKISLKKDKAESTAKINDLLAYIKKGETVTFEDVRNNVPALSEVSKGELHEIAVEAGLEVDL